jgi:hypothetical protein
MALPIPFDQQPPRSASTQIMATAAAERARKAQEEALRQQNVDADNARADQALKLQQDAAQRAQSAQQQTTQQEQAKRLPSVMAADALQWDAPDVAGKPWAQLPPYAKQHFTDAYGEAGDAIPQTWNRAQTAATGQIVGTPTLPALQEGEHMQVNDKDGVTMTKGGPAFEKPLLIPSRVRQDLINMNKWRDGMTMEDAGNALEQGYLESGRIPDRYQPAATKLMGQIQRNPILAPFAKQREAFETMKSGIDHPEAGGFSDMALIEGFQRIVNPGVAVRQGTMDNMMHAAGWLQQIDPSFQWDKAHTGDKLNPQARKRLMDLATNEYTKAQRTANRELASKRNLARMLGIPPNMTDTFVNSVLTYVANEGDEQPSAAATSAAPAAQPTQNQGQVLPPAANSPSASSEIRQVNSQQEYDALPSGTKYQDSNGKTATKK